MAFYENTIIAKQDLAETELNSCFARAKERETGASKWKFNSKNDFKYSVYNIYNKNNS